MIRERNVWNAGISLCRKKSSKPKKQVRYIPEEQKSAVEKVLLQKETVAKVAREMKCSPISVTSWVNRYRDSFLPGEKHVEHKMVPVHEKGHKSDGPKHDAHKIKIVSKKGTTVRFPAETSPETLYGVVQRLEDGK